MRHRLLPLALSALLLAPALVSQVQDTDTVAPPPRLSAVAAALVEESEKGSQVMQHLDYMTNSIGPRLTGSENLVTACKWAVATFEKFGLENVHLEEWGEVPVSFNRGPWFGAMSWTEGETKHRVILEFTTASWSAGTKGLRRGRAFMLPKTQEEFDKIEANLKGAWVVQTRSRRGRRSSRNQGFNAMEACKDAGIRGVVRTAGGTYLRTGGSRGWRSMSMDSLPTLAQPALVGSQHKKLVGLLEQGVEVELEFNIANRFRKGPIKLYNVVADIPGTEWPEEYVLVGAHLDSCDGATGAVDDGSGCATTIEAARLIMAAGVKPKRTIRFCLWGGEEQGLLGSRAYVGAHADEMPKISAYLNHDNGTNFIAGVGATKAMKAQMDKVFAGVGSIHKDMPFKVQEIAGMRGGGSDHTSFLAKNVPAWQWRLKGDHNYRHIWHTQFDSYDQVVARYQRHSALVVAIGATGIANLDKLLSREKLRSARPDRGGRRFRLGLRLDGTKVVDVAKEGLLAKSGLKKGDEILRVGDQVVETSSDFLRGLFAGGGEPVEVTVKRDGKEIKMKIGFSSRRRRR
ncbi:MAG: M20/M25/M40 family metallo-hydrolase [Planctomycetota bacterium]